MVAAGGPALYPCNFDRVKYRLTGPFSISLPFPPPRQSLSSKRGLVLLHNMNGQALMHLQSGFAWDGCSGPCPDRGLLVASAVHDALYALMRDGRLPWSAREAADRCFYLLAKRTVPSWWAWVCWKVLLLFGRRALRNPRPVRAARVG